MNAIRAFGVLALGLLLLCGGVAHGDLIGYWPLDEGSGTATADLGGANAGVLNGATAWTAGKFGSALTFTNDTAYVDMGMPGYAVGSAISVSAWAYATGDDGHIISQGGGWGDPGFGMFWCRDPNPNSIRIELQRPGEKTMSDNTAPSQNAWHHVAFTWEQTPSGDGAIRTYIDGTLMGVQPNFNGPIGTPTQNLNIGSNALHRDRYFQGTVDDVAIWDQALTATDIGYLANEIRTPLNLFSDAALTSFQTGFWDQATTWNYPTPPPAVPTDMTEVIVDDSDLVTVRNSGGTVDLGGDLSIIGTGGVNVQSGKILRISTSVDVTSTRAAPLTIDGTLEAAGLTAAPGSPVSLGNGGTLLISGTANIASLRTGGSATVGGAGDVSVSGSTFDGGGATGTFTKTGPGTLSLDNSSGTGVIGVQNMTFDVAEGTLYSKGAQPLGGTSPTVGVPAGVILSGGTLSVEGGPVSVLNELNYAFFDGADVSNLAAIDDGVDNDANGGLFALTPSPQSAWPGQVQGQQIWTGEVWQGGNISDTYSQMWWGQVTIPTTPVPLTGDYTVYVHGDDNEIFWLDVGQDGDFNAGIDDITRNLPPEGWNTPKTGTVTLTGGQTYDFAIAHSEGGGGDWVNVEITPPAWTGMPAFRINPSDSPDQDGLWSRLAVGGIDMTGTPITVTADSGLHAITDAPPAAFGDLTLNDGTTLTTTGADMTFTDVAVAGGAGRKGTLGAENNVTIANFADGATATTFSMGGTGTLTLDNSGGGISAAATTWEAHDGLMVAKNVAALGGSTNLHLSGGTFEVQGDEVAIPNALRGSIFFGTPDNETPVNLDGANYTEVTNRVFIGDKANTILALSADPNNNVLVTGTTNNWDAFPNFDGNADHFVTALSGQFTPGATGNHNFHWNNDDRGSMFIDLNGDGTFGAGERINGYEWNGNGDVFLNAGTAYNVIYMAQEFGGGQGVWWAFNPLGAGEQQVNPGTQAGMWSTMGTGAINAAAVDVSVSADSTLRATSGIGADFGALTLDNGTKLVTEGAPTTFASVAVNGPAGRTATLAPANYISTNNYSDGGTETTLVMDGSGTFKPGFATANAAAGTTFVAAAGTLASDDPAMGGAPAVHLTGGTFSVSDPVTGTAPASDSAYSYYSFDNTTADGGTFGNPSGALVGNAGYAAGVMGQALNLDGNGDYFETNQNDPYDFMGGPVSFAAWVKLDGDDWNDTWEAIMAKGEGNTYRLARQGNDQVNLSWGNNWNQTAADLRDNAWHHIAVVHAADGSVETFFDGTSVGTGNGNISDNRGSNLRIGGNPEAGGREFGGMIDEVYIFNSTISAADVGTIMTDGTIQAVAPINIEPTVVVDNGPADALMGSIFFNTPGNETPINLDGANFQHSTTRVITGDKANTILIDGTEDPNNDTLITGTTQNWDSFPNFGGGADNFVTAFSGQFTARVDGSHNFHWDNDDRGSMFIDLNGDGTFGAGERVNGYEWNGNGNVTLTAGQSYSMIYMAQEFGGGQNVNWYFTEPGGSEQRVNPGDAAQAGLWSTPGALATSTLQLNTSMPATMQELVLKNGNLRITGGTLLNVQQASVSPTAGAAVGLITETDTILTGNTGFNGNGRTVTITKAGDATLTLNKPGTGLADATWKVAQGTMAVSGADPLGPDGSNVDLAGGTFRVTAELAPGTIMPAAMGQWTFDGDNADDSSGNAYHGVKSAAGSYSTDVPAALAGGKSVNLNGNGYIVVETPGNTAFDLDVMSVAFWGKEWPDGGWEPYVSKRGEGGQGWQVRRQGGSGNVMAFTLRGHGNDDWGTGMAGDLNDWHHYVATFGDGFRRLYQDGVLMDEVADSGNVNDTGSALVFGARDNSANAGNPPDIGNHANIWLDDINIYNQVLGADEVNTLYDPSFTGGTHLGPIDMTTTNFRITADSTLHAESQVSAAFGNVTFEAGELAMVGAPDGVTFTGGGVAAGASATGINNPMDVTINGPYDGNNVTATFTKAGAGALAFAQGTTNHGGVSVNVDEGSVASGGAMQAANLKIAGGANVNTGANDVTVSDGGAFSAGSLKISGSGSPFAVGGDNMAAGPQRLGLSGGTVTVSAGGGMPTGLVYHIDASDAATLWQDTGGTNPITADGQQVARWDDKSPSAINVSEGNSGDQPDYRASVASLNNMPALYFDGDVLRGTNDTGITGDHDLTAITVWSDAAGTGQNYQHTFHMGNTGTREAYGHSVSRGDNNGQIGNHYWGDGWNSSSNNGLGAANIALSTYDSGADQDTWWVNGDPVGNRGVTLNIAANQLQIGSRLNPVTEGFRGNLAEVLIFDQVLTSAQMNDIGGYLAAKYGINAPNWTGSLAVPPINLPDTDVTVSADATLNADTPSSATFGNLDMAAGVDLTLTGAPDGFSFNNVSGGHSVDGGAVTVRGGIDPGVGVESDFGVGGALTLANAATYDWDLGPDADADGIGEYDTVDVAGDLTLGSWELVLHDLGGEAAEWDPLALFTGFDNVTWDPATITFDMSDAPAWLAFTQPEDLWVEHLMAGPRGEGLYLLGLGTVPEPSSIVLMILGGLGLLIAARRRRKA